MYRAAWAAKSEKILNSTTQVELLINWIKILKETDLIVIIESMDTNPYYYDYHSLIEYLITVSNPLISNHVTSG